MAEIDARIPLMFDTSTIYNPVKAQADQIALQKGRNDLQKAEFEQSMQPFQRQKAMDEQSLNGLKVAAAKTDHALRLLDAAQDPSQWGAVRNTIIQDGLAKPNEIPEMYSPAFVQKARMAHMDLKDKLDNQFRNAQLALQREDLTERRADRKEDRALRDRYYDILEKNALTKAGETVDPDTGEIIPSLPNKPMPQTAQKALLEDLHNYRQTVSALNLALGGKVGEAQGDKEATGIKGYLPEGILQRIDPEGVDTRAAIANLGSMVIHDRSGAAVTASEYPRLKPFIPKETDRGDVLQKKLRRFAEEYKKDIEEKMDLAKQQGYKTPQLQIDEIPSLPSSQPSSGKTIKWGDL